MGVSLRSSSSRRSLINSNGTGGLAKSGKTAVDYGVINLKYGVYHIDTAQVSDPSTSASTIDRG